MKVAVPGKILMPVVIQLASSVSQM